jgi:uncharacterized membrane protein
VTVKIRIGVMAAAIAVLATACMHTVDGTASGGSRAIAINDAGVIVGRSAFPGARSHAFVKEGDAPPVDLTPGRTQYSEATGVNAAGVVVGTIEFFEGTNNRAFVWSRDSGLLVLDLPTGIESTKAIDINDRGQILIEGRTPLDAGYDLEAYLWDVGAGRYTGQLGPLVPGGEVWPKGINNRGAVVADATVPVGDGWAPVVWDDAAPGGRVLPEEPRRYASAADINNNGLVVGVVWADGDSDAVYWRPDGSGPVRMAGPPGDNTEAVAVNDGGQAVGYRSTPGLTGPIGIFWPSLDAPSINLEDKKVGSLPSDINASGRSVGLLYEPTGDGSAVWWDPEKPPAG